MAWRMTIKCRFTLMGVHHCQIISIISIGVGRGIIAPYPRDAYICTGVPLHPLYKSISSLLHDLILEHPFLKNCAPFVLALRHLIPSADYSTHPPPPALPLYIHTRLRVTPIPPQFSMSSHPFSATSKRGANIFSNGKNVTC